jgi:CheY-like chemotaxis protein
MRRVAVLLVERNHEHRTELTRALQAEGMPVLAVSGIAEVERWPAGDVVVADADCFTPLWKETGATHVIVLADTEEQGIDACVRGACAWVPRQSTPESLLAVLHGLGVFATAQP